MKRDSGETSRKLSGASPKAFRIERQAIERDIALDRSNIGARGDRKVLVAEIRSESERHASSSSWSPPVDGERAEVMTCSDLEFAFFTEVAAQTRHFHLIAYEIYTVLVGVCRIEVEGTVHVLKSADSLVVPPGSRHQVLKADDSFLAQVLVAPCGGKNDKIDCSA